MVTELTFILINFKGQLDFEKKKEFLKTNFIPLNAFYKIFEFT